MTELLNILTDSLSKAEQAIRDDCPEKLRYLLQNERTTFPNNQITEQSFVNPQIRENLLHFAVHQSANRCINLLLNPPFCWNSEYPNALGHTPLDLAMRRHYLPVVYLLASHSRPPYLYKKHSFSVNLLLIEPSSAGLISEALNSNYDFHEPSDLTWLLNACTYDENNIQYTAENIVLLFELLLSGPICPLNFALWSALEQVSSVNNHDISCTSYPTCLFKNNSYIRNTTWNDLVTAWALHRSDVTIQSKVCNQRVNFFGPLSLMDFCRITIRRHVLNLIDIHRQAHEQSHVVKYCNYANLITQLPISPKLRAFLSYCDLWPNLDRSRVKVVKTNHSHRNEIPDYIINDLFYENT
ncbi:PKC-activated phosphatase-1 inhibitor [Schistosoma japonicum]|nr:PKC-activated phosphatase-1 inhibitor [Schistosoma japonicum]